MFIKLKFMDSVLNIDMINCSYDVFIIITVLIQKTQLLAICTDDFLIKDLDRDEMKKGDKISSQIEQAISDASVHIAIFSLRYVQSD